MPRRNARAQPDRTLELTTSTRDCPACGRRLRAANKPQRTVVTLEGLFAGPDSRLLIAYGRGGEGFLWTSIDRKAPPVTLGAGDGAIKCAVVSLEGRWLVAGGRDRMVRVWDLLSPVPASSVTTLGGHLGPITAVAISPAGARLASGSEDGAVRLWGLSLEGLLLSPGVLSGLEKGVASLAFSLDSNRLAAGDRASVRIWELATSLRRRSPSSRPARRPRRPASPSAWIVAG